MRTTKQGNTIKDGFFMSMDNENWDLFMAYLEKGWKELYYTAPYYWGVANLEERKIFTYTEGDTSVVECKTQESFEAELKDYYKFVKENGTLKHNDEFTGLLKEMKIQ